jgi:hypothetical protein
MLQVFGLKRKRCIGNAYIESAGDEREREVAKSNGFGTAFVYNKVLRVSLPFSFLPNRSFNYRGS